MIFTITRHTVEVYCVLFINDAFFHMDNSNITKNKYNLFCFLMFTPYFQLLQ